MRNIFTLLLLLIFFTSSAQDGILDASYGTNGKQVTSTVAGAINERQQIVTTANGKILQAYGAMNATKDFGLVRYNDDGSLDITFGSGGVVYTDFGTDEVATSVIVQADGKIVVAGYKSLLSGNNVFALARYLSNGTLDASFGSGGKVTTAIGTDDVPFALVENGGVIVAAGFSQNAPGETEFALVRYLSTGALDPSFSGDGKQTTSIGLIDAIRALTVQADGKLVAAGSVSLDGSTFSFALARYNIDGSLDNTFNGTGIVTRSFSLFGSDIAYAVAVQNSTGKIYAAGTTDNGSNRDIAILSYSSAGLPEATFGINGVDTTDLGNTKDEAYSIALQADSKIIVAGITGPTMVGSNVDFAIGRFNNNGTRDVTFGGNMDGFNIIDFGNIDFGYDLTAIGSDIIFGGISGVSLATARLVNSSVILPVNLLSFTASKQNSAVALNWQTASEFDALSFEILRSNDGIHFSKLGTVAASGNSNTVKNYVFTDAQPYQPVGFYRLKIINRDGSVAYSKIVVIRFNSKSGIEAFPNPVRNVLNLQLVQPAGPIDVNVFDISGRLVKSISLRSTGSALSTSIDMGNLQRGVYLIRANEETIRVVKE